MRRVNRIDSALGARLADLRAAAGLSRLQLARRIEADVNVIAGWESGTLRLDALDLMRLGGALGASVRAFYAPVPVVDDGGVAPGPARSRR